MNLHFIVFGFFLCSLKICSADDISNPTPQYLDHLLSAKKYYEFAKIMEISDTDLVNASLRKSNADEMLFYSGTELGDIILRPGQLLNPDQLNDFDGVINLSINKWENGIVPYYLSKEFEDNETELIENEIKKGNTYYAPQIHIRPYQDGDTDYVFIFKGGCGCYTNLGRVGGPQAISMNSPCVMEGLTSHEMTHVLGIPHASNRLDRDEYITLRTENIPEVIKSQYTRYSSDNPANIGDLDYKSIVFYYADTPGFGIPAFDIKEDGIDRSEIRQQKFLSDGDIQRAKRFYS